MAAPPRSWRSRRTNHLPAANVGYSPCSISIRWERRHSTSGSKPSHVASRALDRRGDKGCVARRSGDGARESRPASATPQSASLDFRPSFARFATHMPAGSSRRSRCSRRRTLRSLSHLRERRDARAVRSSARRTELAVRSALGADRRRLILGALVEGGLQATAGSLVGWRYRASPCACWRISRPPRSAREPAAV